MDHMRLIVMGFVLACVSGCSGQDDATEKAVSEGEAQHVWKEQVQTMDKAEQVEKTLLDAQQRRAGDIEKQ